MRRAARRGVGSSRSIQRSPRPRAEASAASASCRRAGSASGAARVERRARVALARGEVALGVERRHAARAGGGDRLAVDVVLDVAGREDAGDVRLGRAGPRDEVAGLVVVELVEEELRVRVVADRDEEAARRRSRASRRSSACRSADARDCRRRRATSSTTYGVRNSIFVVRAGAVDHDLRGAELVAPVDERDLRARTASGTVASSNAESPPPTTTIVACRGRTRRRRWRRPRRRGPGALLGLEPEPPRARAGGDDHGLARGTRRRRPRRGTAARRSRPASRRR